MLLLALCVNSEKNCCRQKRVCLFAQATNNNIVQSPSEKRMSNATKVLEAKKAEFDEIFNYYNKTNTGVANADIGKVIRACGFAPTNKQIEEIQKSLKPNVSHDELLNALKNYLETSNELTKSPEKKLEDAFDVLASRDAQRVVKASDLKHVLKTVGEVLTDQEVDNMFIKAGYDPKSDGNLSLEDFKKLFLLQKE